MIVKIREAWSCEIYTFYLFLLLNEYVYTYIYIYMCVCIYIYVYMYIYVYIIYIYMYIWHILYTCHIYLLYIYTYIIPMLINNILGWRLLCKEQIALSSKESSFFILGSDDLTIFKCFRAIFSLKKKTIQFPLSFNLYFQRK